MSVHRSSSTRILGVAGALWALFAPASTFALPARPAAALAIERMSSAAGVETFTEISGTGLVSFLATAPGAPIPLDRPGSAEERARAFLASYGAAFGAEPGVEMVTRSVSAVDEVAMEHVRFQ